MASSTVNFIAVFLGIAIVLGSVLGWIAVAEDEYVITHERTTDGVPSSAQVTEYEVLTSANKDRFRRAVDAGSISVDADLYFPEVVLRNGTYYHFSYFRRYRWGSPATYGPVLVGLFGVATAAWGIRRDVSY